MTLSDLSSQESVYIARRPTDGAIKIGISHCPEARVTSLGGRKNQLILTFDGGGRRLESELHYQLKTWALPGQTEWFYPAPEVLLFIDRIERGLTLDEALETTSYPFQIATSIREFFALKLPGCTKQAAAFGTGLAYDTVSHISLGKQPPRARHLEKLHEWSAVAGRRYGYCISREAVA